MSYSLNEWVLLFFSYAFIGWVWECLFVSATTKELVNRGFLYGPYLPIYGFGALIVVIITSDVRYNPFLVYIFGMLGATSLEYFTGVLMEKIFKVRYWDYSDKKFNIKGHINLLYTLGWGLGSLVLVYLINPKFDGFVRLLANHFGITLSVLLGLVFTIDVVKSTKDALDLKKLLERLTQQSQLVESITSGVDNIASKINANSQELSLYLEEFSKKISSYIANYESTLKGFSSKEKVFIKEKLDSINSMMGEIIDFGNKDQDLVTGNNDSLLQGEANEDKSMLNKQLKKLKDFKNELANIEFGLKKLSNKSVFNAKNIIKRNPNIVSTKFKDSLQELKALTKNKNSEES